MLQVVCPTPWLQQQAHNSGASNGSMTQVRQPESIGWSPWEKGTCPQLRFPSFWDIRFGCWWLSLLASAECQLGTKPAEWTESEFLVTVYMGPAMLRAVYIPFSFIWVNKFRFLLCSSRWVSIPVSKCSTDWKRSISPPVRTILHTCLNLTPFRGTLSLSASPHGCSGSSKLCGVGVESCGGL